MKKILILVAFAIMVLAPQKAYASEKIAGQSASLQIDSVESDSREEFIRVAAIKSVLARYNSPMIDEAENFVIVANAMDLEPYMLPSMAGVESGFGKLLIPGTNNPFGWNVGRTPFDTWSDGIATVGYALRHKYYDRGAVTMMDIGKIYAGGSITWAPKVETFIAQFEAEEARIRRYSLL